MDRIPSNCTKWSLREVSSVEITRGTWSTPVSTTSDILDVSVGYPMRPLMEGRTEVEPTGVVKGGLAYWTHGIALGDVRCTAVWLLTDAVVPSIEVTW